MSHERLDESYNVGILGKNDKYFFITPLCVIWLGHPQSAAQQSEADWSSPETKNKLDAFLPLE